MSRIAVVGTGYVGLTTGAYLAHLGHDVVCADVIPEKVEMLRRGEIPIVEGGLEDLVREGIDAGRLSFVLGSANAAQGAEFVFLCVPTPQGEDGSADLSYVERAAGEIAPVLESESIVINKSTVPVGSTRVVERAMGREDVYVVSNPEFLREGSAVHDCLNPDRIVIGSDDQAAAIRVASLFEAINAPLLVTDPASAETIKYASNAFLATKISFVNAVANLCQAVGADVREVVLGMGYDKRIGFEFLKPGPGWGGSCFAGDETVVARRGREVSVLTFELLWKDVDAFGLDGLEVLSWRPGDRAAEFLPVAAVTKRPFEGPLLEVSAGAQRLRVTPDHPFVVRDLGIKLARELDPKTDELPVVVEFPFFVHSTSEALVQRTKNVTWVPINGVTEVDGDGKVYSLEVPSSHTVVTTGGLIAHNCFPKDSRALVKIGEEAGYDFALLRGVIEVNDEQYERVVEKVQRLGGGNLDGMKVAVWGLTFKARTDDLRESPSLAVIRRLVERGARVRAFDPTVARDLGIEGLETVTDPYAACDKAEVLAVLTEWDEFRWHDFDKVKEVMARPAVVDGRNLLDPAPLKRRGFAYEGIGRV